MFKKNQTISILFIVISVSMLLVGSKSYAQPKVELVVNPDRLDIPVGSNPIVLTAKASGSNLKFEWELLGPGEFEGNTTRPAIFYKPPQEIEGESALAAITVTVTDKNGDQATGNVTFNITQKVDSTPTTPSTPSTTPESSEGDVKITSPKNDDIVPSSKKVSGTYTEKIQEDIWVLVWPELAFDKGWPQSPDARKGKPARKKDGKWDVPCYFGGEQQEYKIAVYTATPSASTVISDTLKKWAKDNDYPGLPEDELPEGLVEQHRITVTKK